MTPDTVQVVIYDAPEAPSSGCACGCSGHGHDHHGVSDDPLAGVSLEMQAKALALTLNGRLPRPGGGFVCQRAHRPPGAESPPNRAAERQVLPRPAGVHQRPGAVRRGPDPGAHPGRGGQNPGGAIDSGPGLKVWLQQFRGRELQPMKFFLYKQAFYVKLFIPIFLYNDLCPEEKTNISGAKGMAESSF